MSENEVRAKLEDLTNLISAEKAILYKHLPPSVYVVLEQLLRHKEEITKLEVFIKLREGS